MPACTSWTAKVTPPAASQTEKLAGSLRTEGYDIAVTQLKSANHSAPIFHDERDGQLQVIKDDSAGKQVVNLIVTAITAARNTKSG